MKGYIARKGNRWYAVIYEGTDPVTGEERRRWHAAGPCRDDAERLAARLAGDLEGRNDEVRSLRFGAYLTSRWLPGKRVVLAATTYNGYSRNVENHIVPALGHIGLRRLRPHHLEAFYDRLLHPTDGARPLAPKTVYEIHLVIRGALDDAVRRGLVSRNVALVAHAPRLLGLRWNDFDENKATISINRGLVAVPYKLHETRGKTPRSRRRIDLDGTTVSVFEEWGPIDLSHRKLAHRGSYLEWRLGHQPRSAGWCGRPIAPTARSRLPQWRCPLGSCVSRRRRDRRPCRPGWPPACGRARCAAAVAVGRTVKNRQPWTIDQVDPDGSITVVDDECGQIALPRAYAETSLTLDYASTAMAGQGRTLDHSLLLVDGTDASEHLAPAEIELD